MENDSHQMKSSISYCRELFKAAYHSVHPGQLVSQHLKVTASSSGNDGSSTLSVSRKQYRLARNVHVCSFGKASLGMAAAAQNVLGEHCIGGIVSTPIGSISSLRNSGFQNMIPILRFGNGWEILEGAENNLPDERALQAATKIKELAQRLKSDDILIVCVSGGGSALLPMPIPSVSLAEKQKVVKALGDSGASIFTLNTVRQHLSLLKGGGLARFAHPATVIGLIFSDLMLDDPQFVASGPTVEPDTKPEDALRILQRLTPGTVPENVLNALKRRIERVETIPTKSSLLAQNVTIGNNRIALEAAAERAEKLGLVTVILQNDLGGEARERGRDFAELIGWFGNEDGIDEDPPTHLIPQKMSRKISELRNKKDGNLSICMIWGGETTVNVRGSGKGGRNQELVLSCLLNAGFAENPIEFEFLSAGTDGQDGPCEAAGASFTHRDLEAARNFDKADKYLDNNDSFSFFNKFRDGKCHFFTGLTGTNVMDIQILVIHQ